MSSDSDLTPPPPSSQPEPVVSPRRPAGPARRQSTRVAPSSSSSRSAPSRSQSPVKTSGSSNGAGGPRIKLKMGSSSSDIPTGNDKRGTKRKSLAAAAEADVEGASEAPARTGTGRPTIYTKKRKSQGDDPSDEAADSPAPKLKLKFSASKAADDSSASSDVPARKRKNASPVDEDEDDTIVVENQEPVRPAGGGKKAGSKRKAAGRPDAAAEAILDLLEPAEDTAEDTIHAREDGGEEPKKKGKAVKVKRAARARDSVVAGDANFEGDSMADLFGESGDEADEATGDKSGKDGDFVPADAAVSEPPQASGNSNKAKAGGKSTAKAASKKTARQASPEAEVQRKREPKPERRPAPTTARPAAPLGAGASAAAPVSSPAAPVQPDIPAGGIAKTDDKAKPSITSAPGGPAKRAPVPLTGMMPKKKKPAGLGGAAGTATPTSSISLLQNTMAMIGKSPAGTPTGKKPDAAAAKKDTPKPVKRVGQWFEVWGMKPDEQKEFDASAEERAAQRAIRQSWRKAAVNLQASKDAYIVDSVRVRAIPSAGRAHTISTTGSVLEAVTTLHKMMGTNEDAASAGPTLADVSGPWL